MNQKGTVEGVPRLFLHRQTNWVLEWAAQGGGAVTVLGSV